MEPDEVSADHVIPQKYTRGKWTGIEAKPLKAAHKICNSIRGHDLTERPPYYFHEERLKIEARLKHRNRKKAKKIIAPRVVKHDDIGASFADH